MRKKKLWIPAAMITVTFLSTAGSCDRRGLGDAPVGERLEAPRTVIVMPDKFPNLAIVCDGPTRIYTTTREAPPVAVAEHPACEGEPFIDDVGTDVAEEGR